MLHQKSKWMEMLFFFLVNENCITKKDQPAHSQPLEDRKSLDRQTEKRKLRYLNLVFIPRQLQQCIVIIPEVFLFFLYKEYRKYFIDKTQGNYTRANLEDHTTKLFLETQKLFLDSIKFLHISSINKTKKHVWFFVRDIIYCIPLKRENFRRKWKQLPLPKLDLQTDQKRGVTDVIPTSQRNIDT